MRNWGLLLMLVELQYCALYKESIENCILFVIRFNDYFDIILELSIQQIAILCPFDKRMSHYLDVTDECLPVQKLIRRKSSVTCSILTKGSTCRKN